MDAAFFQRDILCLLTQRRCAYAIKVGYWSWLPLKHLAAEARPWLPLAPGVTGFSNYLPGAGYGFGLGFAVRRDAGVADSNGSAGDYNWGGAFGTYFWVDPKEQLVVVSMTQAPGPIRVHYRHLFRALVYQAIND